MMSNFGNDSNSRSTRTHGKLSSPCLVKHSSLSSLAWKAILPTAFLLSIVVIPNEHRKLYTSFPQQQMQIRNDLEGRQQFTDHREENLNMLVATDTVEDRNTSRSSDVSIMKQDVSLDEDGMAFLQQHQQQKQNDTVKDMNLPSKQSSELIENTLKLQLGTDTEGYETRKKQLSSFGPSTESTLENNVPFDQERTAIVQQYQQNDTLDDRNVQSGQSANQNENILSYLPIVDLGVNDAENREANGTFTLPLKQLAVAGNENELDNKRPSSQQGMKKIKKIVPPKNSFEGIDARPFPMLQNGTYLPCYKPPDDWTDAEILKTPVSRGFFYVKPFKTGSSTTSGVHLRIARNVANRRRTPQFNITICDSRFDHGPDYYPGHTLYRNRIKDESFLWTIIRDPTKRAISQFFHFEVSRRKNEPSDANFRSFLNNELIEDYYYRALFTKRRYKSRLKINPIKVGNHILRNYNFIGITERMDESFVALMMILRLRIADILYLSAKTNGGYDDAGGNWNNRCTYIWPSFVSPGMKEYFNSKKWKETSKYDNLFYAAVNRSLDMTIDALGRDLFNSKLQQFQEALRIANERCLPAAVFPCDVGGKFHRKETTDCIWKDSGCGVTCLDDVATELNLW